MDPNIDIHLDNAFKSTGNGSQPHQLPPQIDSKQPIIENTKSCPSIPEPCTPKSKISSSRSTSASSYVRPPPALDSASILSKLLFNWVTPIISQPEIREQNLNDLQVWDQSQFLCTQVQSHWSNEMLKHKAMAKDPADSSNLLLSTLARTFKSQIFASGCFVGIEIGMKIGEALILGEMVRGFQEADGALDGSGYFWAGAMLLASVFHALLHHNYFFLVVRLSGQIKIALNSMIYYKAMNLPAGSTSPGLVVNLVSNDVGTFEQLVVFGHYLWVALIEIPLHGYLLYQRLNWPALVGLIIIFLMIPLQGLFGFQFHAFRGKMVSWRDSRIRLMSDLLTGMNVVKFNAWKTPCVDVVTKLRRNEIKFLRRAGYMDGLNEASFFIFPMLVFLLTFLSSVLAGMPLEAPAIYSSVALFNILRLTLTMMVPKAVKAVTETIVSSKRITLFLLEKETCPLLLSEKGSSTESFTPTKDESCISIKNATFTWMAFTLFKITCSFKQASLTTIIGPVGAGKSSLLQAILGEMKLSNSPNTPLSSVVIEDHHQQMAFAPQTPWILAGSILDNILFNMGMDPVWLRRVIELCCLETDIEQWSHGLHTHVGDRGLALSGGQKARIGLARAIYAKMPVLLLDDPLSAVDTRVARQLFDTLRNAPELQSTARILVTHQLQFVPECDEIIVMEAGRIATQGTWAKIRSQYEHDLNDNSRHLQSGNAWMSMLVAHNKRGPDHDRRDTGDSETPSECPTLAPDTEPVIKDGLDDDQAAASDDDVLAAANALAVSNAEFMQIGKVKWITVKKFLIDSVPWYMIVLVVAFMCAAQSFSVLSDWHLSHWVSLPASVQLNDQFYLHKYWILILCAVALGLVRALMVYHLMISASNKTSATMLERVLDAPLSWFARNPTGRVLNRFTKDLSLIDEQLPTTFYNFTQNVFQALGVFIVIIMVLPWVAIIVPFLGYFFLSLRRTYIASSRQVKRIEASSRSPVYSHLSASLDGLTVIRAMRAQPMFVRRFNDFVDANTRAWFAQISCARWLSIRLDLASAVFTGLAAFAAQTLAQYGGLSASLAGLVMAYALQLNGMLQWVVRQSVELEIAFVSVERMIEYCGLDGETQPGSSSVIPPPEWPTRGHVKITNMSLQYPSSDLPVLKDWNVELHAGEKIGIVGRTGSGKSSFFSALFRTYDFNGTIEIDHLDIRTLQVEELRKRLSIIPQDPFLFKGSLRFNLDPFNESSDAAIWRALESVELKPIIDKLDGKLDSPVEEGGCNYSLGQRQLLCLARSLLKQSCILVCDEATANIDFRSDALIQDVLMNAFPDTLVLTIAHRLSTVIDYDRILILDAGRIVEMGHSWDLLQNTNGVFYQMIQDTGDDTAQQLMTKARASWEAKAVRTSVVKE